MTKKSQEAEAPVETPKKRSAVAQIDLKAPAWIVFYQTETSNVLRPFQGEDAEAQAKAEASRLAAVGKRSVAVFGPQSAVFDPPPPPTATEVQLNWL